MKKKSTIRKVNSCLKLLFVLIAFVGISKTIHAQDSLAYTTEDSLLFAQRVAQWNLLEIAPDSLLDWQTAVVVQTVTEKMEKIVKAFEPEIDSVRQHVALQDSLLGLAKLDSTLTSDSLKTRSNALKEEKSNLKRLVSDQKKRSKHLNWALKLALQPPANQRKKLPELYQRWMALLPPIPEPAPAEGPISELPEEPLPTAAEQEEVADAPKDNSTAPSIKKKEKVKVVRYDAKKDVLFNPAERPCTLAIERTDPFTGSTYRETQKEELFRNTNAVLRKMLADTQAHIICQAALSNEPVTGGGSLHLVFTIKDANARRTFGGLPAKSYLSLKFMDGEIVTIFNEINQELQMDLSTSTAIFQARYGFQPALFKVLMKKELDSIRVAWSTGYEEYSVYNVGVLQEMAICLFR